MFDAADPDPDYEFVWPRELFKAEVTALLRLPSASWPADAELLFDEAFAGSAPQDDLATVSSTDVPDGFLVREALAGGDDEKFRGFLRYLVAGSGGVFQRGLPVPQARTAIVDRSRLAAH